MARQVPRGTVKPVASEPSVIAGVNWTISPAYSGPGTCAINGAVGSQVLACSFGNLAPSTNLSIHIQSATSAVGTAISSSAVAFNTQQVLSIGSVVVQPVAVSFSNLTASQTILAGTTSINLSGVIGSGTSFPPSGEKVSVAINGSAQQATIGANGAFSLTFPTATIPASTTPYTITYSYAGDSIFGAASNTSTTLTVNAVPPGVNLSTAVVSSSVDSSGNYVFTVKITNNGGTTASATTLNSAVMTTVVSGAKVTTPTTTALPATLGNLTSLSSVTTTLTFPASAGPPNTAGAISIGLGFTGGSANSALRATLP